MRLIAAFSVPSVFITEPRCYGCKLATLPNPGASKQVRAGRTAMPAWTGPHVVVALVNHVGPSHNMEPLSMGSLT